MASRQIVAPAIIQSPITDPNTGSLSVYWAQWFVAVGKALNSLPATTFGTGAPAAQAFEGDQYFDTTGSPYHGYIYHSGAWNQFS